ncbi:homeobox protein VENTX isoform X2 [Pongo pygmaeus]|uniref:homeobox protein VENTX isoform X2 n=1 Tax=Pongo pygmaeus TaxID=9600 RepID=UPI00300C82FE
MRLSSSPPRGGQQPSSFGSVDWLSQSSCSGTTHTPRPADVSPGILPGPGQTSGARQRPQAVSIREAARSSNLPAPERAVAGLSKEPNTLRAPRVRTAFTTEQVRTLEGVFQHHQYLSPLERKRLAREMQLSEIKTWFQNRRMKHKRQMQDPQLHSPFSGSLHAPPAFHSPSSGLTNGLQLLCPWAPLSGPQALMLPPGSFWGLCQVAQEALASAEASCCWQPLASHPPTPGSGRPTLGPALSTGPRGLCALPQTGDAF